MLTCPTRDPAFKLRNSSLRRRSPVELYMGYAGILQPMSCSARSPRPKRSLAEMRSPTDADGLRTNRSACATTTPAA